MSNIPVEKRRVACLVPSCPNTSTKRPDKLFVVVNKHLKKKWCMKMNIHFNPARRYYWCEDHLNVSDLMLQFALLLFTSMNPMLSAPRNYLLLLHRVYNFFTVRGRFGKLFVLECNERKGDNEANCQIK